MHEMSIAMNILDIASQQAREAGAKVVHSIEIEVGDLAGIEVAALEFCFETARRSTQATSTADLVVHRIEGTGRCVECRREVPVDFYIAFCPDCPNVGLEIIQGRELKVRSLQVD